MNAFFLFSITFLFVATTSSFAKSTSDCRRELMEKCKDKTGKERFQCLRNNTDSLDAECKAILEEKKGKFKAAMGGKDHPCAADRDKCKDNGGGHEQVMKCLIEKRDQLSESCKAHLDGKMEEKPCLQDRMKFCKDVPKEGVYECLKAKEGELANECKVKIARQSKKIFEDEN